MAQSKIEWTEETWNPVSGCSKISSGCKHCYAEIMTRRLQAMGVEKYKGGFNQVVTHAETLNLPFHWKKPREVFVNSMSDLFHEEVPLEFVKSVFTVMNECSLHTFQLLTKRAERLAELSDQLTWSSNIWMGVSVENQKTTDRIPHLNSVAAQTKFLSIEPLLSHIHYLDLSSIDWVIVGGESGPKSRPIKEEWVLSIKEQCESAKTAFFFKQWGGKNKKAAGRTLLDRTWDQMPHSSDYLHTA